MTKEEKENPLIIYNDASRRKRIARGAAIAESVIKKLLKQYKDSATILDIAILDIGKEEGSTLAFSLSIDGLVEKGFIEKSFLSKNGTDRYIDTAIGIVKQSHKQLLMLQRQKEKQELSNEQYSYYLKQLLANTRQKILE